MAPLCIFLTRPAPFFSGSLDLDIAGTITPHAFVGGIYAVSGPTASGFAVMEDGEFWDVEITKDSVSFWTTGISESVTGGEIVSAVREYGQVTNTVPDLSGLWSAREEKTVSAAGLHTVVSDSLTIAVNQTSGKLFAGTGLGGKIGPNGSVVFGTRIDDAIYLYRGWVEEGGIHATRVYTENTARSMQPQRCTQRSLLLSEFILSFFRAGGCPLSLCGNTPHTPLCEHFSEL